MIEIKNKKLIPIKCDMVFKKVWGDPDNVDRLSTLLSIILRIPYERIKNNIEIIESEKRITNHKEKINRCDVVAKVKICSLGKVNLEMNLGFYKTDLERNLGFISYLFSSYLRSGEDYRNIEPIIQINFNDYDVDSSNKDIIDIYMFMNKNGRILTDKLQIQEINIEKCLGEINMEESVKKDIEATERLLSAEETIMAYYGSEEEQRKREKWTMQDAIDEATKRALKQGINKNKAEIAQNMLN